MVDDDDFEEGFRQGFQAIAGSMRLVPLSPLAPLTPLGKTAFQVGIIKGIEAALGRRLEER